MEKLVYPSLVDSHFQDFNLLVFVHNQFEVRYTATSKLEDLIIMTQAHV